MSGHSKWAGIKHKKAAADAKRANVFTRLANAITIAARRGGGDPEFNPALRTAVDTARKSNMPKENVERAIKRGTGELSGIVAEELLYEGFGPGNVAILVSALTDNRNRTTPEVKLLFTKNGGRFAEGGGVAYQFTQKGVVRLGVDRGRQEQFEELVIEAGADDYVLNDGYATIYTSIADLHLFHDALLAVGFETESTEIEYVPNVSVEVEDDVAESLGSLVEALENHDDVTGVYTNAA
jgi:YebC/PmpR family DNA-binding regulatory protein